LDLYDFYAHGKISKREFLKEANRFTVSGITALGILKLLSPNYAYAEQVNFNDPEIKPSYVTYNSPLGNKEVKSYLVEPKVITNTTAAVLVIHENRGLNPYIKDVARRVAKAGFVALAPDGLTSKGGYPGNDEKGKQLQKEVDPIKLMNDFFAGYEFLQAKKLVLAK